MNYAIALAILDEDELGPDTKILIGIRKPESNAVHPNVVSVPTQRIPASLFSAMSVRIGLPLLASLGHAGENSITYAVQALASQKLGLATAFELGEIEFAAAARTTFKGVVPVLTEGDVEEPWTMILVEVHFNTHIGITETESYKGMRWMGVTEFLKAVDDKDSFLLDGAYPMGGLCIACVAKWLRKVL